MILGLTGTRYGMTKDQMIQVVSLIESLNPSLGRHGDCIGADEEFHELMMAANIPVEIHPPENSVLRAFCKGAQKVWPVGDYKIRNMDIVNGSDALIGISRLDHEILRSGTWHALRYARKVMNSKNIYVFAPNGKRMDW